MKLSQKQQEAKDQVMSFMHDDERKSFAIAGYAGTGKSTTAAEISKEIDTAYVALTGKAANVLREKGCDATTIHSALYVLVGDDEPCKACSGLGYMTGAKCKTCKGEGSVSGEPRYVLNQDSDLKKSDLVIVDEYSMLDEKIIADLESVCKKTLYLGDPFQLPPINGECIIKPDIFLEEIHRQALESSIIRYATDVREGRALSFVKHDDFVYQPRKLFHADDYDEAEQIIVGYNKTRTKWNERFREKLGFAGCPLPVQGDKLICLKNNHEKGLFNGMIGMAKSDARQVSFQEINLDFEDHQGLHVWDGTFKNRKDQPVGKDKRLDRFDYAYVITCHKAQGSEFDDVLIYNEPIGKDSVERRRWLYTAITRGKKKVKLVQP